VQTKARQIHVIRGFGAVQDEEDVFDLGNEVRSNALTVAVLEQPL